MRVDAIDPDPDQPRSTFNDAGLELAREHSPGRRHPAHRGDPEQPRPLSHRPRRAPLAGFPTGRAGHHPAVVRRRDYDDVTRLRTPGRGNIQREDLNDVDRAAALLRLRLMQEELDATQAGLPRPASRGAAR